MKPTLKQYIFIPAVIIAELFSIAVVSAQDVDKGMDIYNQNCTICHGDDATGAMPGVLDLTEQTSWFKLSEKVLVRRIRKGIQKPGSAVAMPPNGGNPDLTEVELIQSIQYIRKLVNKLN